jgi:hypothetical protein
MGEGENFRKYIVGASQGRLVPPQRKFVKNLTNLIYDMMLISIADSISQAKKMYCNLPFVFLTCDTWTDIRSRGFAAIEITYNSFDKASGKIEMRTVCLGCFLIRGRHTGEKIAEVIKRRLARVGLLPSDVLLYCSDSGGGVPAAAKYLDWFREACCLHTFDTINGWALGSRGKESSWLEGTKEIHGFVQQIRGIVTEFAHGNQKIELFEV